MKILIVSRYAVYPSWQGSAQHVYSFAKTLKMNGHNVELVSGEDVEEFKISSQDGYKVYIIPLLKHKGLLDKIKNNISHNPELYKLALEIYNKSQPDSVHFGAISQLGSFVEAASDLGLPSVAMVHDFFWTCPTKFFMYDNKEICSIPVTVDKCTKCIANQDSFKRKILYKLLKFLPTNIILILENKYGSLRYQNTISEALRYLNKIRLKVDVFILQNYDSSRFLADAGISSSKMKLVSQALTEDKLIPKLGRKISERINVGYIGRISNEKGIDILFKALDKVKNKDKVVLTIISQGVSFDILSKYYKLPRGIKIDLLGNVSDLAYEISKLNVCVSPSIWYEIGPRTIIEAMAQKVPCIVSDTTGNRYLIQNKYNGMIFQSRNYLELSKIINEIVCNPETIEKWKRNLPVIKSEQLRTKLLIDVHEKLERER